MRSRLYVDEVGNSDMGASHDPNHRYLSLTGIAIQLDHVQTAVIPRLQDLSRRYFGSDPDEPVILHRKEILNAKHPFEALRDSEIRTRFDTDLVALLEQLEYTAFTVVIDKLEHNRKYQVWRYDPYHYCLSVLVERYVRWLDRSNCVGDIMAEARGGREDRRLKDSYERLYERGTAYIKSEQLAERLTSRQLTMKDKKQNILGLQLADLIAHPSFKATLARKQRQTLPSNFGGMVARLLERSKYDRSPDGRIEGWGRKWLP